MERRDRLQHYQNAHAMLIETVGRYPRSMWHYKASKSDWSIHEILVHITDSEANSYIRCRRLIAEPGARLTGYDEMAWAKNLDYHALSTDDAIELFRLLRGNTYALIKDLPEPVWANSGQHTENGLTTLDDWLVTYANHVPEHIDQMDRVHAAWQAKN
jgi:hypothetical protein